MAMLRAGWIWIVTLGLAGCAARGGRAPALQQAPAPVRRALPELIAADSALLVYVPAPERSLRGLQALLGRLGEDRAVAATVTMLRRSLAARAGLTEVTSLAGLGIDPQRPVALTLDQGRLVLRAATASAELVQTRFDAVQRQRGARIFEEPVGAQRWRVGREARHGAAMALADVDGWTVLVTGLPDAEAARHAVLTAVLAAPTRTMATEATFAVAQAAAPGSPFLLLAPGVLGLERVAVGATPSGEGVRMWFEGAVPERQHGVLAGLSHGAGDAGDAMAALIGADALLAAKGELALELPALARLRAELRPWLGAAQRWLGRIGLGRIELERELLERSRGPLAAAVYMPSLGFFLALGGGDGETLVARLPAALSLRVRDPAAASRSLGSLFGASTARRGPGWVARSVGGRAIDVHGTAGGKVFRALTNNGDTLVGAALHGDLLVLGTGEGFDRTLELAQRGPGATSITDADLPSDARAAFQADDGSVVYSSMTPAAGILALARARDVREVVARGVASQLRDVAFSARLGSTGVKGSLQLRLRARR
ncbi:MAG: hypothetical protein IT370_21700 [Deltaproteobacteria bacterium]|nr:hypothetical protein [Deltaproteobacteria bacterium]